MIRSLAALSCVVSLSTFAEPGQLRLVSLRDGVTTAGADVLVDGVARGKSPLIGAHEVPLEPGPHHIVVRLGGKSVAADFDVKPGFATVVRADVERGELATQLIAPKGGAAVAESKPVDASDSVVPEPTPVGSVRLQVFSNGDWVDGSRCVLGDGLRPRAKNEFPGILPGIHVVHVVVGKKAHRVPVVVRAGELSVVRLEMTDGSFSQSFLPDVSSDSPRRL